jgi:hypothetical protein
MGGRGRLARAYTEFMPTAKDEVRHLLDTLPETASLEDIQYAIYVRERIERGLREAADGKLIDVRTRSKRA